MPKRNAPVMAANEPAAVVPDKVTELAPPFTSCPYMAGAMFVSTFESVYAPATASRPEPEITRLPLTAGVGSKR